MAVFRIERTRDYTVMSNHHLRNEKLSLKAKGLLSMMLSLPDDWNYTTRGLAKICKEGVDAIGGALRELESAGYIVRHQLRDRYGRISDTEYVIYEQPQPRQPDTPQPDTASPDTENPYMDKPDTEKPAELNIEKSNTQKSITHGSSTDSIPFRETAAAEPPERKGRDAMSLAEIESYRELILENIEYDYIKADMFTKRTIKPHEAVTSVDTASEALAVSIAEKAHVDMAYMEQLTGKTGTSWPLSFAALFSVCPVLYRRGNALIM